VVWAWGFGAVRRRFCEKGEEFEGLGVLGCAWISGGD
jgi:hypothetical protein